MLFENVIRHSRYQAALDYASSLQANIAEQARQWIYIGGNSADVNLANSSLSVQSLASRRRLEDYTDDE